MRICSSKGLALLTGRFKETLLYSSDKRACTKAVIPAQAGIHFSVSYPIRLLGAMLGRQQLKS